MGQPFEPFRKLFFVERQQQLFLVQVGPLVVKEIRSNSSGVAMNSSIAANNKFDSSEKNAYEHGP